MAELRRVSTEKLEKMVDETAATLQTLKAELRLRHEASQHAEIDRLDEHLANATLSLQRLREFIDSLMNEFRRDK